MKLLNEPMLLNGVFSLSGDIQTGLDHLLRGKSELAGASQLPLTWQDI